jgi:hypothetical protein
MKNDGRGRANRTPARRRGASGFNSAARTRLSLLLTSKDWSTFFWLLLTDLGEDPRQERQQLLQRTKTQHLSGGHVLHVALETTRRGVRLRLKLQDKGPGVLPAIYHERSIEMAEDEVIIER